MFVFFYVDLLPSSFSFFHGCTISKNRIHNTSEYDISCESDDREHNIIVDN